MAYPVSTVPAAVTYLISAFQTQLSTDPNPQIITLYVGNDPGMIDTPDLVGIEDVTRTLQHFAMVGDGEDLAMYEKYSVIVKISSSQRAATQAEASLYLMPRVWKLLSYLELAVRLDPSLGMEVLTAWPGRTRGGLVAVAPDLNGWICEMQWQVDVEATQ